MAPDGALYVGNGGNGMVGRFDDAASLSGVVHGQPQGRFAIPGVGFPGLIGLDAGGDLWVARNDVLVRITNPGSVAEKATAPVATTVAYPPGFGTYAAGGLTFVTLP